MTTGDNIEKDFFADTLRSRLENHEMPVDEQCWADIEKRMQAKKRIIPFWLWSAIGGAAAVALLFVMLLPFQSDTFNEQLASEFEKQITEIENGEIAESQLNKSDKNLNDLSDCSEKSTEKVEKVKSEKTNSSSSGNKSSSIQAGNNKILADNIVKETISTEKVKSENIKEVDTKIADIEKTKIDTENKTDAEVKPITAETNNKATLPVTLQTEKQNPLQNPEKREYVRPKRKNARPMLAAAFGSSGGVDFSSSKFMDAAPVYENLADVKSTYARIMAPNEFSSITDIAPLSFGMKISKEFAPDWSIESGLIYTYMATTYKGASWGDINADMNLHYLGIPLNLKHNISQSKKWEVYISGGAMMEKGLRSIYNQYTYSGNYTYKTVAKTKIEGLQFSMSGATGISYNILRQISVYAEPSITWYFENNQPRSARTQQPLVVGLNGGMRFKL